MRVSFSKKTEGRKGLDSIFDEGAINYSSPENMYFFNEVLEILFEQKEIITQGVYISSLEI